MPRIVTLTPNPALDYSAETDSVQPNRKIYCDHARSDPGGGGINVARAAARLGAETLAIFPAGGPYGAALAEAVLREGVAHRRVDIKGETRLAFAVRDRTAGDEYRFGLAGAELRPKESDALLAAMREEVRQGDFVVGSGSLPPGAPADFWARAAQDAARAGAKFVLDTSKGEAEAIEAGLFLLRKNKYELAALAGRDLRWPEEVEEFALRFVDDHKVEKLAVTHGGDGAIMTSGRSCVRAPGFEAPIVSAVGAGDSFVGALVFALINGENDARALRWGMAAATATLMTPGTALFEAATAKDMFEKGRELPISAD